MPHKGGHRINGVWQNRRRQRLGDGSPVCVPDDAAIGNGRKKCRIGLKGASGALPAGNWARVEVATHAASGGERVERLKRRVIDWDAVRISRPTQDREG